MKKYFVALFLIVSMTGFSQITSGVYKSSAKNGDILLKINQDKTYEMSFFYGDYTFVNDTIQFNSKNAKSSSFSITNNEKATKSSTLKLKFNDNQIAYYATTIFVATQESEKSEILYKKLSDYVKMDQITYEYPKEFSVELEKGNYLYLIDAKNDVATISKFQISEDTNELLVEYDGYSFSNVKLKGFIDATTGQLAISDGKTPLLFSFEKQDGEVKVSDDINPLEVKEEKDWIKTHGFANETDSNSVGSAYAEYNKPPYVFKHSIEKNYKDALKSIQKSPSKLLVVAFDLQNKNAKIDFDSFIKSNEETLSSYMYDNYKEEYDKFVFYLATEKDKSLLDKNKINSEKEVLFFNFQGDLLYHTSTTLTEKQYDYFNSYSGIHTELDKIKQYVELDKSLATKNISAPEIVTVLKKSLKLESSYSHTMGDAVVDPAAPPVYNVEEKGSDVKETIDTTTAVDSSAATVYEYDYSLIKDKQNLYPLKSTKEFVQSKWLQVIDFYLSKKMYDKDFVLIAKAELQANGFSNKLFNDQNKLLDDSDFKLLDYVFNYYQSILNQEETNLETQDYSYYESPIATVLYDVFYTNTNLYSNPQKKQIDKVMNYYEKFLKVSKNDFSVFQNYLTALKENSNQDKKYIDYYDAYFNEIIKKDSNIIEDLDTAFSNKMKSNYDTWESFKSSFSNLANDVAWHVVEKSNDKSIIQKAIVWSETSLKVSKDVHYYLDTLAQLYYKNGETAKAISTEEKALELGKDSEYEEQYKEIIDKMKNGTY